MKSSHVKEQGFCTIDKPYIINLEIFLGKEPVHILHRYPLFHKDLIILLNKTCYKEINSIVKVVEYELMVLLLIIYFITINDAYLY